MDLKFRPPAVANMKSLTSTPFSCRLEFSTCQYAGASPVPGQTLEAVEPPAYRVCGCHSAGRARINIQTLSEQCSRFRLILTIAFIAFISCGKANSAEEKAKKWNVLFIMSDDMRPTLGCYGHEVVKSPNIDGLAQRGVRFDRAYCQYPLCNPSRTSLLTGRHPTTSGVLDNIVDFRAAHPEWVSLPQHFRDNGYASLRCGKIFHGGIDDAKAWDEGGDPPRADSSPRKPLNQADRIRRSDQRVVLEDDGQEHSDYRVADQAIQYLQRFRDKPFFLACGFTKPIAPLQLRGSILISMMPPS